MITPSTYEVALLLAFLTMICWGSWANTFKMAGKWRFELYYFDYAFGVLLAAIVAGLTFGSMGDELTFWDNLTLTASKRAMAWALAAGAVFNLANMLLMGAISIAGMAVAFPIGIGLALIIGTAWSYGLNPQGNIIYLAAGCFLVLSAVVVNALAYQGAATKRAQEEAERKRANEAINESPVADPDPKSYRRRAKEVKEKDAVGTPFKGIALAVFAGLLMGSFYPLLEISREGEIGLGSYSAVFVFAAGVFLTTFVYNLYFMNLPVQGPPVEFFRYFQGNLVQHLLGVLGGIIWCVGMVCSLVVASTPKSVNVGPAVSYALGQGATLVSALWGILVWREFKGAGSSTMGLLALMLLLFVAGLTAISLAPLN